MSRCDGTRQFGRIPYELADSGCIAKLTGCECKVYIALAVHLNGDWAGSPGLDRIAKMAGVDRRNAWRAVTALEAKLGGRLVVERGKGGRSKPNTYRFAEPDPDLKRVTHDAVTLDKARQNGPQSASPMTHEQRRNNKKKKKQGARKPAAKKKPPEPFRLMTDLWCSLWAARYDGQKYPFVGAKDGQAAKRVFEAVGEDLGKVRQVFKAFLADAEPFYEGHTLAMLASAGVLPKFLARLTAAPAGGDTAQDRAGGATLDEIGKYLGGEPAAVAVGGECERAVAS